MTGSVALRRRSPERTALTSLDVCIPRTASCAHDDTHEFHEGTTQALGTIEFRALKSGRGLLGELNSQATGISFSS